MRESPDKSRRKIIVCRDDAGLTREAATLFERLVRAAPAGDPFTVALAGGSTPRQLYSLLGSEPIRSAVPWDRVHLFWGDERCVPPEHPDSNFRMAQQALVSKVPIPPENVFRIPAELDSPQEAAARYEAVLTEFFGLRPGKLPRFDLVFLGIGDDGHTASLFPGSPALEEKERLVVAPFVAKLGAHRITLTVPVLNHARRVVFLAAGRPKAAILRAVLQGERKPFELPAQLIQPTEGQLLFLFDRAADSEDASGLGV